MNKKGVVEAKRRIQECLDTQSESLDLSWCDISTLENIPELLQCTHIKKLKLSSNRLEDISALKNLEQLTSLNLSLNPLADISVLKDLEQLTKLDLSSNQLADISVLKDLEQLTSLDLSENKLTDISGLKDLEQLTSLDLTENKLTDISVLKDLKQLTSLYLSDNKLTDISALKDLGQLKELYLGGNQLTDISVLKGLGQLTSLYLSFNQLTDISVLKGLEQLTSLDLRDNQLTDISVLKDLKQLAELHLSENKLTDISVLKDLGQLKELYLGSNQLTDISVLKGLGQLTSLDLTENKLTDISVLKDLEQLTSLYLSGNELTDISALKDLKKLRTLWVSDNQISSIPEFIFHLSDWKSIVNSILDGNPVVNPPIEKIKQGREAVLEWFRANKVGFKEIKILLVGEHNAGKTSLLKVLKQDEFDENEPQTDGINIVDIDFEKNQPRTFAKQKKLHGVKARFWDFGGQEILKATHKLFFTSRSLYILLFKVREDMDIENQVRDKVLEIKSGGGNSPILVVANQIDNYYGFEFINTYALQEEFPQIKAFLKISCKERTNIEELKNILEKVIPEAGFLSSEISEEEMALKNKIVDLTQEKSFIGEDEFNKISAEVGLVSSEARINAVDFLDKVGLVVYFSKIKIADFYVLDPNWVTSGLYRIITSKKAAEQKGIVRINDLDDILNDEKLKIGARYQLFKPKPFNYTSKNERTYLSEILIAYKLAFKKNEDEIVLPSLLKGNPSDDVFKSFEQGKILHFIYSYIKIPTNMISQIIVRLSDDKLLNYWRTGCHIEQNDCESIIASYNNRIEIKIKGEDDIKRRNVMIYLTTIIEEINEDLPVPPVKMIPLPNTKGGMVEYEVLINMFKLGKTEFIHNKYKSNQRAFNIIELLDGIPQELKISDKSTKMLEEIKDTVASTQKGVEQINKTVQDIDSKMDKQFQYLIKINQQNQQIQDKIKPAVAAITDKTMQEEIYQDMKLLMSNVLTLMDEELQAVYQEIQKTDVVSSKLELSIPFLNVLGVNYKTEIDLKQWKKNMYEKYKLPLFNLFGYVE